MTSTTALPKHRTDERPELDPGSERGRPSVPRRHVGATNAATPISSSQSRSRLGELQFAFLLSVVGYLGVARWMLAHKVIFPDSVSRVANAYYVLYSRDPHLPAIGFVWNPLPSLLLLPVLPLKGIFPSLTRDGFAGPLESAVFMAGAVVLMLRLLRLLGVGRGHRWILTALFALHPMIVTYAGSGESEGMLLFFGLLVGNCLAGWLVDPIPSRLIGVGVALGGAYLTRYEAAAPAAAVVILVLVLSYLHAVGSRKFRTLTAVNDALLTGLPFLLTFVGWALSSRVLVKSWFPTFSSSYGNSSQVANERQFIQNATGRSFGAMLRYSGQQIFGLQPFLIVLLALALVTAVRRRSWAALSAPVVLGSILVFDNWAFLSGTSFGWLRFQITAVPLGFILAGTIIARGGAPDQMVGTHAPGAVAATGQGSRTPDAREPWSLPRLGIVGVSALTLVLVGVSLPISALTLTNHAIAREETSTVLAAVDPGRAVTQDRVHLRAYETEHAVADYLDAMHLPAGSVLTDAAYSYDIVLASHAPRQFVITSDRDFALVLDHPARNNVRYLLVPDPSAAPFDALSKKYPGLYADGGRVTTLVRTWKQLSFGGDWRLYRVDLGRVS